MVLASESHLDTRTRRPGVHFVLILENISYKTFKGGKENEMNPWSRSQARVRKRDSLLVGDEHQAACEGLLRLRS